MPRAINKQKCTYCSRLYTPCKACQDEVFILEIGDTCQRCYVSKGLEEARERKQERERDAQLSKSKYDEILKKYEKNRMHLHSLVKQYKEIKLRRSTSLSDTHSSLQTPQTSRLESKSVNYEEMEKVYVHLNELSIHYDCLFDSKETASDLVIECGSKKFKAHSTILSNRSPTWKQLCKIASLDRSYRIRIDELKSDTLNEILHYTYSGRCNVDKKNALEVYVAAERFQFKILKTSVENYLLETMDETNALSILQAFDKYSNQNMKYKCINLLNTQLQSVFSTQEWNRIKSQNPDLVYQVYESRINH